MMFVCQRSDTPIKVAHSHEIQTGYLASELVRSEASVKFIAAKIDAAEIKIQHIQPVGVLVVQQLADIAEHI